MHIERAGSGCCRNYTFLQRAWRRHALIGARGYMRACVGACSVYLAACAAVGFTVPEAQTVTMLSTVTAVQSARNTQKKAIEFVYLGGAVSPDRGLGSGTVRRRLQRIWSCFR